MSTQNRTKANSNAPVSSHPLFPAIVALWFGALFGLGSLAVRASLIESLVISSHIDVVVPMAAPPLGMTARILLALFMAMIGIAAGAAIARRIARPKPVAPNRRRTAVSVSKSEARNAAFEIEAQAQLAEQKIATEKADAVRRRALAVEDASRPSSHRDAAPLPGSAPQILDVTQFDLAEPGSFEADLTKQPAEDAPLDLTGFAAPQAAFYESAGDSPAEQPGLADPATIAQPVAVIESYGDDTDSFHAKFANEKKPIEWVPEPPPGYVSGYDETSEASDVASDAADFDAEPAQLQPQGQSDIAESGPVADMVTEDAEAVAAAISPEPRRFDAPTSATLPGPVASLADADDMFADEQPLAFEPSLPAAASDSGDPELGEPEFAACESDTAALLPLGSAAERIASADLAELSPVELVERFALALKHRRHTGAFPAGLLDTAAAFDLPVRPQASQVPQILAEFAPLAEPVATAAPEAPEPIVSAPLQSSATGTDNTVTELAPVAAMCQPLTMPLTMPLTLPAAMRPIEFNADEEHDDLPSYAPPRSFAMPSPVEVLADDVQQVVAPLTEGAAEQATEVVAEAGGEVDVNEEGYSSLLALSRSAPLRQTFIRIEEPESELAQVEPVVIFPGQATRPGSRFARPAEIENSAGPQAEAPQSPVEVPQAGAPALRRFDAPPAAAPVAAAGTTGVQDPAEAERALRSALATLQRMSGAA